MTAESREKAQADLDAAVVAYLAAHVEEDDEPNLMLEGFVLVAQGRELSLEGADRTTNIWATPDSQAVSLTMGLTQMLRLNVDAWFQSGVTRDDD